jgi:TldD protein
MMRQTRRDFLATTSLAAAGITTGTVASALPLHAARVLPLPATALLPEPMDHTMLQSLASASVDAARQAGASFADVRVGECHGLGVELGLSDIDPKIRLETTFRFGVRVLVDGVWAFEHGVGPSLDAVTTAARRAVDSARGYRGVVGVGTPPVELAPAPAVQGTWATPITTDPFTVPIIDQYGLLIACREAGERIRGGGVGAAQRPFWVGFTWTRETRVFASSTGSLLTQTIYQSEPNLAANANRGMDSVSVWCPDLVSRTGGYESVLIPNMQEQFKSSAEEAERLASLPKRPLDVGRYPVIFDGYTVAAVLARSVGHALEMDRVRGDDADASGTSYLAPAEERLGTALFSPLLNVTGHRSSPVLCAVKWDDEGIESEAHQVIRDGRIVDYHTGRDSAPALATWYQQQGRTVRSHGCATAPRADDPVLVRAPHLMVTPGSASLDDMIKGVEHGILVRQAPSMSISQQMASGSMTWGSFLAIRRGKIVNRISDAGIQFNSQALWKSLANVGDSNTVRTSYVLSSKGQPWSRGTSGATAPAGFFKEINVVSTARSL